MIIKTCKKKNLLVSLSKYSSPQPPNHHVAIKIHFLQTQRRHSVTDSLVLGPYGRCYCASYCFICAIHYRTLLEKSSEEDTCQWQYVEERRAWWHWYSVWGERMVHEYGQVKNRWSRISFGSPHKWQAWFSPQIRVRYPVESLLSKASHTMNEHRGIACENQTKPNHSIYFIALLPKLLPSFCRRKPSSVVIVSIFPQYRITSCILDRWWNKLDAGHNFSVGDSPDIILNFIVHKRLQ